MSVIIELLVASTLAKSHVPVVVKPFRALVAIAIHEKAQFDGHLGARDLEYLRSIAGGALIASVAAEASQSQSCPVAVEHNTSVLLQFRVQLPQR